MIELEKKGYLFMTGSLLFLICLFGVGNWIAIPERSGWQIALGIAVIAALTVFCYVQIKGRILMLLSLLVGILVVVRVAGWQQCSDILGGYAVWLFGKAVPLEEDELYVLQVYQVLQIIGTACICFVLQTLAQRWKLVGRLLVGLFLVAVLADLFGSRQLEHRCIVGVMGYAAIIYIEWTQQVWRKHKGQQNRVYMIWIMPFILFYLFLMYLMPAPDTPYDWGFAQTIYQNVRESCIELTQHWQGVDREDFSIAWSGFSGSGRLLGTVLEDDSEVMCIQGQKSLKTNVYLVGKVYDTFTVTQWLQTNEVTADDRMLDAAETLSAVRTYDKDQEAHYLFATKLTIDYRYFRSGYLFTPLKAYRFEGQAPEYEVVGGNLVMPQKQGYGMAYEVRFLQMNVDHPLFYEFLEQMQTMGQTQEAWNSVQKELGLEYPIEALETRRKAMYEVYGQSVTLSPEVEAYLQEITRDAQTTVQKLKAIEKELAGFTYTTQMEPLSEEITSPQTFLDAMLLEQKEGFCSYFATAFVLLARAQGIPARYVEGFCVPVKGEGETLVYANMAHAWPEVYLEGAGWIPFEPTPGYDRIRYTPWEIPQYDNLLNTAESQETDSPEDEEEEMSQPESEPLQEEEEDDQTVGILLYSILLVAAAGLLFFLIDAYLSKRRNAKRSIEEKFQDVIWKNLKLLEVLGYQRLPYETLSELQARAWAIMQGQEGEPPLQFAQLYEEVVYGQKKVSTKMLTTVQQEKRNLLEQVRRWKPARYYYFRFFRRW